jgi:hypothetical protein
MKSNHGYIAYSNIFEPVQTAAALLEPILPLASVCATKTPQEKSVESVLDPLFFEPHLLLERYSFK